MTIANGLYWFIRDYYAKSKSSDFINKFGYLFEDYIKELASIYCEEINFKIIPKGKRKGADYLLTFDNARMIIEAKSFLMCLDGKQQVPCKKSIDEFLEKFKDAYKQLQCTCEEISENFHNGLPLIKVLLLYEDFSNTTLIKKSADEIFSSDNRCFIMRISEFEILLYLNKFDKPKCKQVIESLLLGQDISTIYNELLLYKYSHFKGDRNYWKRFWSRIKDEIKEWNYDIS